MKVFWSWQSDTPGQIGRYFVRDALNQAITRLKEAPDIEEPIERETRSALHLDQDRKGIPGSPDLAPVILNKISQAAVFVGDVTPIGIVPSKEPGSVAKKIMNPNVAIELGYALHALTDRALLMVMNEHYGSRADLPFDLQSKAGPLMFRLSPDASKDTIAAEARKLTADFVEALRPYIEKQVQLERVRRPFPAAKAKAGPARFRASGESLGIRDGLSIIDSSVGSDVFFAAGAALWLRVMPTFDPGRRWSSAELKRAINSGINLPPLIGISDGMRTVRAEDGVGICVFHTTQAQQTDEVAFAFETGEIWAISTFPLRTNPNELFVAEVERSLVEQLPLYGRFLNALGGQSPYKWIAGVSGVKGRDLQYPLPPGAIRIPGLNSSKCASDEIIVEGSYEVAQSARGALLAFFNEIYNKCGMTRPDHLPVE